MTRFKTIEELEEFKKYYIAYKSFTNFVDIIPQKNNLTLVLNIAFNLLNDPKELCKDLSGVRHWGNGDVEFKFSSLDQIDYAIFLIKQSLDLQLKNEN